MLVRDSSFEIYNCMTKFLYWRLISVRDTLKLLDIRIYAIPTFVPPAIRMYTSDCSSPPSPQLGTPGRKVLQILKCFECSTLDRTLSALTRANAFFSEFPLTLRWPRINGLFYTFGRAIFPQFFGDSAEREETRVRYITRESDRRDSSTKSKRKKDAVEDRPLRDRIPV